LREEVVAATEEVQELQDGVGTWQVVAANAASRIAGGRSRCRDSADDHDLAAERRAALAEAARRALAFRMELQQQREGLQRRRRPPVEAITAAAGPLSLGRHLKDQDVFEKLARSCLERLQECQEALLRARPASGAGRRPEEDGDNVKEGEAWQELMCIWRRLCGELDDVGREAGLVLDHRLAAAAAVAASPGQEMGTATSETDSATARPRTARATLGVSQDELQAAMEEGARRVAAVSEDVEQQRQRLRQRRRRSSGEQVAVRNMERIIGGHSALEQLAQHQIEGFKKSEESVGKAFHDDKLEIDRIEAWKQHKNVEMPWHDVKNNGRHTSKVGHSAPSNEEGDEKRRAVVACSLVNAQDALTKAQLQLDSLDSPESARDDDDDDDDDDDADDDDDDDKLSGGESLEKLVGETQHQLTVLQAMHDVNGSSSNQASLAKSAMGCRQEQDWQWETQGAELLKELSSVFQAWAGPSQSNELEAHVMESVERWRKGLQACRSAPGEQALAEQDSVAKAADEQLHCLGRLATDLLTKVEPIFESWKGPVQPHGNSPGLLLDGAIDSWRRELAAAPPQGAPTGRLLDAFVRAAERLVGLWHATGGIPRRAGSPSLAQCELLDAWHNCLMSAAQEEERDALRQKRETQDMLLARRRQRRLLREETQQGSVSPALRLSPPMWHPAPPPGAPMELHGIVPGPPGVPLAPTGTPPALLLETRRVDVRPSPLSQTSLSSICGVKDQRSHRVEVLDSGNGGLFLWKCPNRAWKEERPDGARVSRSCTGLDEPPHSAAPCHPVPSQSVYHVEQSHGMQLPTLLDPLGREPRHATHSVSHDASQDAAALSLMEATQCPTSSPTRRRNTGSSHDFA